MNKIISKAVSLVKVKSNNVASNLSFSRTYYFYICGVPNVGKSTIINSIRNSSNVKSSRGSTKVAKTGAKPGLTQVVSSFKVNEDPPSYLLDSPGVMIPSTDDPEVWLKLALIGAIKDSQVDEEVMADYLLWKMNTTQNYGYLNLINKKQPNSSSHSSPTVSKEPLYTGSDNIEEVLTKIASSNGYFLPGGQMNLEPAAKLLINKWRAGELGHFSLDDVNTIH